MSVIIYISTITQPYKARQSSPPQPLLRRILFPVIVLRLVGGQTLIMSEFLIGRNLSVYEYK